MDRGIGRYRRLQYVSFRTRLSPHCWDLVDILSHSFNYLLINYFEGDEKKNKTHVQTNTCHILREAVTVVGTKRSMCQGKRKRLLINPIEQCNGTWLVQRRGDKAIVAKIRNDAEDRSLNE